ATRTRIMPSEQTLHRLTLVVLATDDEFDRIVNATERVLCPDPDHPGPCPTPWTLTLSDGSGFDDEERARYLAELRQPGSEP
ncbi:MAG TPA: hypothetical protein VHH34_19330, partial [Pseudonocardiaceae bacterium]|nr:hypothetical protein [Pseudonocardiaceae bacterium]